jgi:hypothetical protein
MQTPPPRPTRPGIGGTDDDTVLLNTQVIAQARRTPPRPSPSYASRPYPPMPVGSIPTSTPSPALGGTAAVEADDKNDDDEAPKLSLTGTQVVASMSAAVVAAFLGAQLGVAGTVIGAAIASVISVVGSAVIGHSLLVTRHKVAQTVQHVRAPGSPADEQETALLTAVTRFDLERTARPRPTSDGPTDASRPPTGTAGKPTKGRRGWWTGPGRLRWVLVGLATSVLVFAGALGAVTVVEAIKGAPISGGTEGGFSVLGGNNRTGGDSGTNDNTTAPPTTTTPSTATVTETTTAPATSATSTGSTGSPTAPTTSSSVPTTSSSATSSRAAATTAPSPTATAQTPTVTPTG